MNNFVGNYINWIDILFSDSSIFRTDLHHILLHIVFRRYFFYLFIQLKICLLCTNETLFRSLLCWVMFDCFEKDIFLLIENNMEWSNVYSYTDLQHFSITAQWNHTDEIRHFFYKFAKFHSNNEDTFFDNLLKKLFHCWMEAVVNNLFFSCETQ